ncbi:MAG: glycosyltransferase, partial [Bacteroidetes bacterium]|nr:glycosyltransferase [Bacteroidota bacterium]
MKVSIITISFNSGKTIEGTIKSVLAQDHPEIEYIIIDGNSRDNTMEIVNKYQNKIDIIVSENDQGIYDAMN